ncbi:MAG: RDD family protein [Vibrio sp.]
MKPLDYGQPAGLIRRLAALFYDGLLLVALLMTAAGIVVATLEALNASGAINYGIYQDVSDFLSKHPIWSPVFSFYLVFVWVGFFIWFWRKGQTLGMRAWQLRVQNTDRTPISTTQALIRLVTALFGFGNLLVIVTRPKRSLQDICSRSQVVLAPVKR